ncbi:MAG: matrixin family metalloprotease [Pseudomonadota bacterium]
MALLIAQDALAFKIVSFNGKFTRWIGNQAHYVLDRKGSHDFDGDALVGCDPSGACVTVQEAVRKSFDAWEQVSGADVRVLEDPTQDVTNAGYDRKNTIQWVEQGWRSLSFAPPSGALAVTICTYRTNDSANEDCDILFNGENFKWGVINSRREETSGVVDIQNIATHEIGHFFGVDHSSEDIFEANQKLYLATMFFTSGPGETFRRILKDDDIAALRNLYPDSNVSDPVVEAVTPDNIDAGTGSTVTVQIQGRSFDENATALIAVNSDQTTDIVGNVVSVSDTQMNVEFDVSRLATGQYDVIVANTYNRTDRLAGAVSISGGFGQLEPGNAGDGQASTDSGGCSVSVTDNSVSGLFSGLMMILLPLILIGTSRMVFARTSRSAKTQAARRP